MRTLRQTAWRLLSVAVVLASAGWASAQSTPAPKPREWSGGPYCGIYSLYAAFQTLGVPVTFETLLRPEYLGSDDGSTLGELRRAAEDHGLQARPLENLSATALRATQSPIILHVRRPGKDAPFLHWVLFLGLEGDNARIVDPPNAAQLLPFAQLLSLWDGVGLVVSNAPAEVDPLLVVPWLEEGIALGLVMVGLWLVRQFSKRHAPGVARGRGAALWSGIVTGVVLVGTAAGLALVFHGLVPEGFLRNRAAVAQVVGRHFEAELHPLSPSEVEEIVGRPGTTAIDARFPQDYAHGHLPGAINLPVFAGLVERDEILSGIDPADQIIVYCQSDKCLWGEAVASDLVFRGFHNVFVFPAGWRGWQEYERTKQIR